MTDRDRQFQDDEGKRPRPTSELASKFAELGDEDISAAIDGLISSDPFPPATTQNRLNFDRQTDAELKEMFNNIVLQFLDPVGYSIHSLADYVGKTGGKFDPEQIALVRGNVDACIGALRPLIKAADAIKYHDIYDVLKAIERPLLDVQQGKRAVLTDRDTKHLARDFDELTRLINQNLGQEQRPLVEQQVKNARERYRTASNSLISEVLPYFKEVQPTDIQKLFQAGITRLNDLVAVSAKEISDASGVSVESAEKIKLCSLRALMNNPQKAPEDAAQTRASKPTAPPSPQPEIAEPDGPPTLTEFEEPAAHPVPPPMFFPELQSPVGERERLMNTLEVLQQEIGSYSQSASSLNVELERTHRALLRLRVERERLRGELEFHREELKQFFDQGAGGEEEAQEALALHKLMFQSLRQVTELIVVAMRKIDIIYGQMEDAVRDVRDLEIELSDLRRKRRGPRGPRVRGTLPEGEGG